MTTCICRSAERTALFVIADRWRSNPLLRPRVDCFVAALFAMTPGQAGPPSQLLFGQMRWYQVLSAVIGVKL